MTPPHFLLDLAEAMFATDEEGRLVGEAPHLHVLRTPERVIARFHADLSEQMAARLADLAQRPRGRPSQWAREYADYADVLQSVAPLQAIRAGPLCRFPKIIETVGGAIAIREDNADLLLGGLDEWRPDVAAGLPMAAVVVDGRAVSICASVNASKGAHCAGVETLAAYRGKGLAAQTVSAWARQVRTVGAEPIYGTTFDNLSSQAVARRLGLDLMASEFSIECRRE
jgi:GNAT superfamily N-acetyltransferase